MSKVTKAYSLDYSTYELLEDYCRETDNWDKKMSRSKVVNDAIVWFLSGDVAELVHNNEQLVKKFGEEMRKKDSLQPTKSWWRVLLGL